MSTGPRYADDALISYGHIDNQPLEDEERGWVDNLHERLEYRLGELLGHRPRIWRDPRLPGNVYFANELTDRLRTTCVLVSVLSPGYLQSKWCMGELVEFCRAAEENGGLKVGGGRLRVFKVVKTFVERDQHPAEFQGQLGYEFYEIEQATGRPVEYGQQTGRNRDQRYWDKLNDLAWDIKQTLVAASPPTAAVVPHVFGASKGTVYLAETSYDLREERDRIKRELQERGYDILPNRELPYKSPEYQEAVREGVLRAKLSVHLIGASYGIIPEGASGSSVVRLQNEIAAERSGDPAFKRLIWLPERLAPQEGTQTEFIEYLKTSADPQRGAELLQTTLEELKSVIQVRLSGNGHRAAADAGDGAQAQKKIYLLCDPRDVEGIVALNDFLYERGYDVLLPLLDVGAGDDAQAIETHKENLATCDAALVYYGSANQAWFDYQRRGLEKAAAQGRDAGRTPLAWGVYVGGPVSPHKQLFRTRDSFFVKNFGDFTSESLKPFLDSLGRTATDGDDQ